MSSSLELNSEAMTFCPSTTRVSEMCSRPDASWYESSGSIRCKTALILASKLHLGEKGPRMVFLTSFTVEKKNSFRSSETEGEKQRESQFRAALTAMYLILVLTLPTHKTSCSSVYDPRMTMLL